MRINIYISPIIFNFFKFNVKDTSDHLISTHFTSKLIILIRTSCKCWYLVEGISE